MLSRFFLFAFALCWLITLPIALEVQGVIPARLLPPPLQFAIGLAPLIAAWWVTRGSADRGPWLQSALRFAVPAIWYVVALLLPWFILGAALAFDRVAGRELPELWWSPQAAIFGILWLVLAFGEEAGWRAFALPRLLRTWGFWPATTILGAVWCVWHYPRLFASPYLHFDAQGFAALAQFSLQILVANYLIGWLYVRTRSAILTAIFHAGINTVATVYSLAAIDPAVTLLMAAITACVVLVDRRAIAGARSIAT